MPAEIKTRFDFAQELILRAGDFALDYFSDISKLDIRAKGVQDTVSQADIETEQLIRSAIADNYPQDAFFGEESGGVVPAVDQGVWVVDPIDGTANFTCGLALWCVSIAYVVNKQLVFGLVYDPVHQELFSAQRQQGAYLNGKKISTAQATALDQGRVNLGFSTRSQPQQIIPIMASLLAANGIYVNFGSGALGLCHVACGRCIGYYEPHINSWDCYAAALIVQEAGGYITDVTAGDKLRHGCAITACCPGIRQQLEDLLKSC